MRKKYRVVNTSTYQKRLILGSQTHNVPAKGSIETELTQQEFDLARRSPDILISEIDTTPKKIKERNNKLNRNEHFQGYSSTVAPRGDEQRRPLYEHFMVEIFGLKSRIAQLEAKNAELEASLSAFDYDDLIGNYLALAKRVTELEKRPTVVVSSTDKIAASELLNVDANPQENKRAVFEKIIEKNKKIRT